MAYSFLQGPDGNYSNGRLIGDFLVISAVVMVGFFMYIGVKYPEVNLMNMATAIGVLFGSIAGSALISLFGHKVNERKSSGSTKSQSHGNGPNDTTDRQQQTQ